MTISDLHFLVAEDHDFQRKTLVVALKSLGAKHIIEAADGRLALGNVPQTYSHHGLIDTAIRLSALPG